MNKKVQSFALEKALETLGISIKTAKTWIEHPDSTEALKNTLKAGVIQHFELSYELSWKLLKRQLEQEVPTPAIVDSWSFQELIREGFERHLITDASRWLEYRHMRNLTSHTYNQSKADQVYKSAIAFYQDALQLLKSIQSRNT